MRVLCVRDASPSAQRKRASHRIRWLLKIVSSPALSKEVLKEFEYSETIGRVFKGVNKADRTRSEFERKPPF